ncbi:YcjF family protein [Paludisphaera mucosa]|uniref:GTP-binding protein n=1 Tax=Paludisphaera mucosa TaxID=3030827 RepID=A0ABT6F9F1_9BACT|nr:GTP-binding protein [Paludisphaera mucosa]MDG3004106.1 GTP-binding protein [Paludisphaera mucosa]
MRPSRLSQSLLIPLAAALTAAALFLAVAMSGDRLGGGKPALLIPLGLAVALTLAWAGWTALATRKAEGRDEREESPPLDPVSLAEAAELQAARAREHIEKIRDVRRREELRGELDRLDEGRVATTSELDVVVFGTVSAGKTSLINALIGREVGATGAVMGTTRQGENHVYTLEGVEGIVRLVDTPGLSEAGLGGGEREQDARRLAQRADLLLFVVDHDLVRGEYAALNELARLGKRTIVVFNKKNRFPDADRTAILARIRSRVEGVVPADDVVTIAAAPRPIPVRVMQPDGSSQTVYEVQDPDVQALRDRIARVLANEGRLLRVANLLLKTRLLGREAESTLDAERRLKCDELVDHYQWVTATTVFANPVPALNLLQGAAVQLDLIADLARVYDLDPGAARLRALGGRLAQAMLKVGLVEAASSVVAGVFKRTPTTFVAAGAVQAVTMAYLARIAGKTLADYFRDGETWGPEGIEGAVLRQFEANSRADFLQEFARQAIDRFLSKVRRKAAPVPDRHAS